MMLTRADLDAGVVLALDEIAVLEGAGARRVVVELDPDTGDLACVACWTRRGAPDLFIGWRLKQPVAIAQWAAETRAAFIKQIAQRLSDFHRSLPMTDDELAATDGETR